MGVSAFEVGRTLELSAVEGDGIGAVRALAVLAGKIYRLVCPGILFAYLHMYKTLRCEIVDKAKVTYFGANAYRVVGGDEGNSTSKDIIVSQHH